MKNVPVRGQRVIISMDAITPHYLQQVKRAIYAFLSRRHCLFYFQPKMYSEKSLAAFFLRYSFNHTKQTIRNFSLEQLIKLKENVYA